MVSGTWCVCVILVSGMWCVRGEVSGTWCVCVLYVVCDFGVWYVVCVCVVRCLVCGVCACGEVSGTWCVCCT